MNEQHSAGSSKERAFREALMQIRERAFRLSIITCPDTCAEYEHPLCWIARTADSALRAPSETPAVQMTDLSIEAHEGQPFKAEAHFKGEAVKVFAATAIEWFRECQGDNFVTVDLIDPTTHERYSITMQRAKGKTPAQVIAELRDAQKANQTWIAGDGPCNCGVTSGRPWHLPGCSSLTPPSQNG